MSRTITTEVFKINELSDEAKQRAIQKYRENGFDYDWWDDVYEDAAQIADILGIDMRRRRRHFHSGKIDDKGVAIYFSGFSSQGDGACFEGFYSYAKGCAKKIRKYAPKDEELHGIADALAEAQKSARYALCATIKHSGHYSHSGCMTVDVRRYDDKEVAEEQDSMVTQCMRDFADWIYKTLKREWDWRNEDEQIIETMEANGYEFTADGKMV